MTPKHFQTFETPKTEAGYYAELNVFGGILSLQGDKCAYYTLYAALHSIDQFAVVILYSKISQNIVSIDMLRELRNLGLCRLPPPSTSISNCQETPAILCDSDDEKPLFVGHCVRDYPGTKLHPNLLLPLTDSVVELYLWCQ